MKHISESIIGKRGNANRRPVNWDVIVLENLQHLPHEFCLALFLNNATARARQADICHVVELWDRSEINSTLSSGRDILVLYDPKDGCFFWQHSGMYAHNLKVIPDKWMENGKALFEVVKNTGQAKLRSSNFSIKDIFQDNNYFKDRL